MDGDNFFVCWDPRLIPKTVMDPNLIDEAPKSASQSEAVKDNVTYDMMLDFFIDYTNYEKLGQIDNSHLVHADMDLINYARNKNCQKLAEIHGKAVDFPKTGYCPPVSSDLFVSVYPDFMQKHPSKTYISKSVLGKLYQDVKEKIQRLLEDKEDTLPQYDLEVLATYPLDQSAQEMKECLDLLKDYEREVGGLIHLVGVDSEFEIYSGNFSIVKDQVKGFGKHRLIQTIMSIRKRFFDIFFENDPDEISKYEGCEMDDDNKPSRVPNLFGYKIMRKTQLFYLVSYLYRFPHIHLPHPLFPGLKQQMHDYLAAKMTRQQGEFCGFVWFIVPRVIINLKST